MLVAEGVIGWRGLSHQAPSPPIMVVLLELMVLVVETREATKF